MLTKNLLVFVFRHRTFDEALKVGIRSQAHLRTHPLYQADSDFSLALRYLRPQTNVFAIMNEVEHRVVALTRREALTEQRGFDVASRKWSHASGHKFRVPLLQLDGLAGDLVIAKAAVVLPEVSEIVRESLHRVL